jgi:hypothetical protein
MAAAKKIVATICWKEGRILIVPGGLQNYLSRKRPAIAIVSLITFLLAGFLYRYEPSSPAGVYYDPDIACGHGCWIFKDGKVYIQCDEEPPEYSYVYLKLNGQWVLQGINGESRGILKASLFGLKLISPQIQHGETYWARDGLSWVIVCKKWIGSHPFP